jgi:hypothetical protein
MNNQPTIATIHSKIALLRKLDGNRLFRKGRFKLFGSSTHHYHLNPCLPEETLSDFEKKHRIHLPDEYRRFLKQVGNGGCGPAYGFLPLLEWNTELEATDADFLATPFQHTDKWNKETPKDVSEDYYESDEFYNNQDEYYDSKHISGSMRISHYGCAIYYLLVVSGPEAGKIWIDDRASDGGIFPAVSQSGTQRISFLEWYDEWLTESIEQMKTLYTIGASPGGLP